MPTKRKSSLTNSRKYKRRKQQEQKQRLKENTGTPIANWDFDLAEIQREEQKSNDTPAADNLASNNINIDENNNSCSSSTFGSIYIPPEQNQFISSALTRLENIGLKETMMTFFELVSNEKFPLDNIALQLFLDVVNWYSLSTSCQMRYPKTSKEFWWTGEKLFGAKFLRFMEGFKHKGKIIDGTHEKGYYDPQTTTINFAVPNAEIISHFVPSECLNVYDNVITPGVIGPLVDLYAKSNQDESHILTFDGKKIIPNSADIDLLDCDEQNASSAKLTINEDIAFVQRLIEKIQETESDNVPTGTEIKNDLKTVLQSLSMKMKECRQMCAKKKGLLERLKEKSVKSMLPPKANYLINCLQTCIFQCNGKMKEALANINELCRHIFSMNQSEFDSFKESSIVDMNECANYLYLEEPLQAINSLSLQDNSILPLQFTKQRSTEWFERRQNVKITGSIAQKAAGLDTLKDQKEIFDKVISKVKQKEPTDEQAIAMKHGQDNEINAVATLCCKVMPVLFPQLIYCEEGAYSVTKGDEERMIVSPDGSLRLAKSPFEHDPAISIEIKCPVANNAYATPVHYTVPHRYICQSLLEQHVLKSKRHLYISWSSESTTVFEIPYDQDIVDRLLKELDSVFYSEAPKRPTRLSTEAKDLAKKIKEHTEKCHFLGEFPSMISNDGNFKGQAVENTPYRRGVDRLRVEKSSSPNDIIDTLVKSKSLIDELFKLYEKKASEVVVFTVADVNRIWARETSHGMPIGYVYRGYSLATDVMRKISERFLKECETSGIHIPCITFDGQWVKLKDEDSNGNPLSIFQLKRNYWKEINSLSKAFMLDEFGKVRKNVKYEKKAQSVIIDSKTNLIQIRSPIELYSDEKPLLLPPKSVFDNKDNENSTTTNSDDLQITEIIGNPVPLVDDREMSIIQNTLQSEIEIDSSQTKSTKIKLDLDDIKAIQSILLNSSRKRAKYLLSNLTYESTKTLLSSAEGLKKLTDTELRNIVNYVNTKLRAFHSTISTKLNKVEKINALSRFFGDGSTIPAKARERVFKVQSLQAIVTKNIKKTFPKQMIESIYAGYHWQTGKRAWINSSPLSEQIEIENTGYTIEPTYIPTKENDADQAYLRVSCLDGHHLRTNVRAKICKAGTNELKTDAWRKVAQTRSTPLIAAMIEVNQDGKIMDQQNEKLVRVMFCENVENEMRKNGDVSEANFCRLFREWHEAEDLPGIQATERCKRALRLREWLLKDSNLDTFPPAGSHVKGFPRVTYEGLISNIEAHLYLYQLSKSGTYNWRSMSTLVAESFFGEIAEMEQHNNGVPSGTSFQRNLAAVAGLHCMRLNPERSFCMQTAKSRAYPIPLLDIDERSEPDKEGRILPLKINKIYPRNHLFDLRREVEKKKFYHISEPNEIPKGVQPIRNFYRIDESKMLMSSRLGISTDEIEI